MKHCIIVKFNDAVTDKTAMMGEIGALFAPCAQIDGVHGVSLIPSVVDRPNRYDLIIAIDMEPEALVAYDASEAHRVWKRDYAHLLASKAIFDGEF